VASLRRELHASQFSERLLQQQCDESERLVAELKVKLETLENKLESNVNGAAEEAARPSASSPSSATTIAALQTSMPAASGTPPPRASSACACRGSAFSARVGGAMAVALPSPGRILFRDNAALPVSLDARILAGLHPADLERLSALTERNLHEIRMALRRTNVRLRAPSAGPVERLHHDRHQDAGGPGGAVGGWDAVESPSKLIHVSSTDSDVLSVVGEKAQRAVRPATSARREAGGRLTPTGSKASGQPRTPSARHR